jgi:hypothetical protein
VGPERGPLSLVSTIEELLGRKSSGSGLENRDYVRRESFTLKLPLASLTSGGRSVSIVHSRTKASEWFVCFHTSLLVFRSVWTYNSRKKGNRCVYLLVVDGYQYRQAFSYAVSHLY